MQKPFCVTLCMLVCYGDFSAVWSTWGSIREERKIWTVFSRHRAAYAEVCHTWYVWHCIVSVRSPNSEWV